MLKAIRLINFGPHMDTTLELHEGLNSLIGSSGTGKSTVVKAILQMVENYRSDKGYHSHWTKKKKVKKSGEEDIKITEASEVHFIFDNGIVRKIKGGPDPDEKTKQANFYQINDDMPLRNFTSGTVPKDVTDFINIKEVNIQKQIAPYYLLTEKPPAVAKALNKIVDLEQIDSSLSNIESDVRRLNSIVREAENNIKEAEEELKAVPNVVEIDSILTKLENQEKQLKQEQENIYSITESIQKITAAEEKVGKERLILSQKEKIDSLIEKENTLNDTLKKIESIKNSINKIESYTIVREKHEAKVSLLPEIEKYIKEGDRLAKEANTIKNLSSSIDKIVSMESKMEMSRKIASIDLDALIQKEVTLRKRKEDIDLIQESIDKLVALQKTRRRQALAVERLEMEFHEALKDAPCPLCGRTPDGKQVFYGKNGEEVVW